MFEKIISISKCVIFKGLSWWRCLLDSQPNKINNFLPLSYENYHDILWMRILIILENIN